MTKWIIISAGSYVVLGLLTGIRYLIICGKQSQNCWERNIDENNFATDDEIFAFCLILFWPIFWIIQGCIGIIKTIEKFIVIPIVNKKEKKESKNSYESC